MSSRDEKTPPNPNATNERSVAGSGTIPTEGHKTGPRDGKYADTADASGKPMKTVGADSKAGDTASDVAKVQTGTPVSHPPSSDY